MSRPAIDWPELQRLVDEEERATPAEADYVVALQRAIEQRNPTPLLCLLDAAAPLPSCLGPALAAVLRGKWLGLSPGHPPKTITREREVIARVCELLHSEKNVRPVEKVINTMLARSLKVDVRTIERVRKRQKR